MSALKQKIIETLKNAGADIVVCGNIERFSDPAVKKLMPKAKSVICAACRQLRGARRGVEEGTSYHHFTTIGIETPEENILPGALLRACGVLEAAGFKALPQRRNQLVMASENDTNPEVAHEKIFRGRKAETQLDFTRCAVDAGLGEIGLSGSVLTDDFGPCQRWAFIITEAELEPDPVAVPHLCDKCGECVKACPGHAISPDGKLNRWQCAAYYAGASRRKNPFMPTYALADNPDREAIWAGEIDLTPEKARAVLSEMTFYPSARHAYTSSMCGKACDTECYIHLEQKGVLKHKFSTPFRKRPKWELSVHGEIE